MSIKTANALKALETKHKDLQTKRNLVIENTKELQLEASSLKKKMGQIRYQISELQDKSELVVSEHAMLRYIEVVLGIDLEELSLKITEGQKEKIKSLGDGKYTNKDFTLVVKNNTVTTIEKD